MKTDDPRHGTEAGAGQHVRDGEDLCDPCHRARLIAFRRRGKRSRMGITRRATIGSVYDILAGHAQRGASHRQIGDRFGVAQTTVTRILKTGSKGTISVDTKAKILANAGAEIVTPTGVTRRIRALTALGYTAAAIAEMTGLDKTHVKTLRDSPAAFVMPATRAAVVAAYDRYSMTLAPVTDRYAKAQVSRMVNHARREGWPPPLALDDDRIDDPGYMPRDWHYTATDRATALRDMAELGVGVTEACRRLHVTRDGLEKWAQRNSMSDVYRVLAAREAMVGNQYTREDVA